MSSIFDSVKDARRLVLGRLRLWRLQAMSAQFNIGSGFFCGRGCFASRKNRIRAGRRFYMGNSCHLGADADIGDDVLFGSFVSLVGGDHRIDDIDVPIRDAGRDELRPVRIEDDVWVGHGAIILHGVTLGAGAVIGAGAVVTKDVPPRAIVAGNPAEVVRYRRPLESS